ncbi:hypothetical protein D3C85_1879530 [compost metagenome]
MEETSPTYLNGGGTRIFCHSSGVMNFAQVGSALMTRRCGFIGTSCAFSSSR